MISGKTTLAKQLTTRLNGNAASKENLVKLPTLMIPMDGYHLPRAQLDEMEQPDIAHLRRGAEFTFDATGWTELISKLSAPISDSISDQRSITAPSFDHSIKDPIFDDIFIESWHRIIILEGNYVALNKEPWSSSAKLMKEIWFVHVEEGIARERLAKRHVESGIVGSYEDGIIRADKNDLLNGRQIIENKVEFITETLESYEDENWKNMN